jgi:putative acetyltransferase
MVIRREIEGDVDAISAVTAAAFQAASGAGRPAEVALVSRLREDDGYLPALSLVALDDGVVIGHLMCTRGFVDDRPAAGLGPISVLPDRQRRGVGHALMHAVLGAADASGEPLVAALGDPRFYGRFGFVVASELGVLARVPGWGAHFQARALSSWTPELVGTFRYAKPFAEL